MTCTELLVALRLFYAQLNSGFRNTHTHPHSHIRLAFLNQIFRKHTHTKTVQVKTEINDSENTSLVKVNVSVLRLGYE